MRFFFIFLLFLFMSSCTTVRMSHGYNAGVNLGVTKSSTMSRPRRGHLNRHTYNNFFWGDLRLMFFYNLIKIK